MMLPVAATAPGASKVDILVATTRRPDSSRGALFSGERSRLTFANIVVSIPPDNVRKIGEVQWPQTSPGNPVTDFVTLKADRLDAVQARAWIGAQGRATPKRHVLVFVHGFNTRFDDTVFHFAQFVHDSGAEVAPVLFTWPSRANLFAYGYDRESTNFSRDALEQTLNMLARDSAVGEIDILAHSMGNWLTLETLRQMAIRDRRVPAKIHNVMLAAPDVDVDVFANQIDDLGQPRPNFSLLVSQDDKALQVSRHVWGSAARLGSIEPQAEPYKSQLAAEHIAVIDLTQRESDDPLKHGKFADSPELVRLIAGRIANGQTMDDSRASFGDGVVSATTGAAASVGTAAGIVIAAPVAVVDPATRRRLSDDIGELESEIDDTVSAGTTGPSAR